MANKKIWLGMLVILLILGATIIGCGTGSLNGTWVTEDGRGEIKFSSGRFEYIQDGDPYKDGTYTTSGNKLTLQGESPVTYSVKGNKLTFYYEASTQTLIRK